MVIIIRRIGLGARRRSPVKSHTVSTLDGTRRPTAGRPSSPPGLALTTGPLPVGARERAAVLCHTALQSKADVPRRGSAQSRVRM